MTLSDTETMLDRLAAQQQRIGGIVAELDDETLRRTVLPSGWSPAGMVQHLTATTHFWFANVMAGEPEDAERDDFDISDVPVGTDLVAAYAEAARAGAELARPLPLSTPVAWWPEGRWGPWRLHDLNEVLLHLLVETSTHAGHLDIARELIDGRTWDYPGGALSPAFVR